MSCRTFPGKHQPKQRNIYLYLFSYLRIRLPCLLFSSKLTPPLHPPHPPPPPLPPPLNLPPLLIPRRLTKPGCVGGKRFGTGTSGSSSLPHNPETSRLSAPSNAKFKPALNLNPPRSLQSDRDQSNLWPTCSLNLDPPPSAVHIELLSSHHPIRLRPPQPLFVLLNTSVPPPYILSSGRLKICSSEPAMEGVNF